MTEDNQQEIGDEQILNPYGDDEAEEFYREVLVQALENNSDVKDFVLYGNQGLYSCDILVKDSTENIDNIMYNLDTSSIRMVQSISNKERGFEFDFQSEWQETYEEGLIVTISLIPLYKRGDNKFKWCPIHPIEVLKDPEIENYYYALSELFGGQPQDYKVEDNSWVERSKEYISENV